MSKGLPIRRRDFDVPGFVSYLAAQGCEIGKPSNPYEVVRYRAYWQGSKAPVTHIVYAKGTGLLTWTQGTQAHYDAFLAGIGLLFNKPPKKVASELKPGPSKSAVRREALLERDGGDCWFCGTAMGDDCTIEHLVPKSKGGANSLQNYALAHQKCNAQAADLPLVQKIALRERMRADLKVTSA